MAGDDRVRHCTLCDLNVYNFAAMTRDEVRALLIKSEGRLCARLYRRADGTLLTKDCPTGLRALQRRVSRFVSAMMAAVLSIGALASGCASARWRNGSKIDVAIEQAATPQPAVLTGVVVLDGSPLPGATITVRNEASPSQFTVITDEHGAFTFHALHEGIYRVEVELTGLHTAVLKHLALKQSEVARAHVAMRMDAVETVTVGGAIMENLNEPLSTTFTQDFLDKLPH